VTEPKPYFFDIIFNVYECTSHYDCCGFIVFARNNTRSSRFSPFANSWKLKHILFCFPLTLTLMTFHWIYQSHRYLRSHLFFNMIISQMCFVHCWIHSIPTNFTFTNMLPVFTFLTDWLFGIWNFISRDLRGCLSTTYNTWRISGFLVHCGLLITNEPI
jgi:hypothetical protein